MKTMPRFRSRKARGAEPDQRTVVGPAGRSPKGKVCLKKTNSRKKKTDGFKKHKGTGGP